MYMQSMGFQDLSFVAFSPHFGHIFPLRGHCWLNPIFFCSLTAPFFLIGSQCLMIKPMKSQYSQCVLPS